VHCFIVLGSDGLLWVKSWHWSKKAALLLMLAVFIGGALVKGASAMFWPFKRYEVEMSPRVTGRIANRGEPVVGLTVTRDLYYQGYKKGENQSHSVKTDQSGRFQFEQVLVSSRYPGDIFGQNFPVVQRITAYDGERELNLWATSKTVAPLTTISRLLSSLKCDLNAPEYHHEMNLQSEGGRRRQPIMSICLWEGEQMRTYLKDEATNSYIELKTQGES